MGKPAKTYSDIELLRNSLQESLCVEDSSKKGLFPIFVGKSRGKSNSIPKHGRTVPVSRELLSDLYIKQKKTRNEIAEILGAKYGQVGNWLNYHRIKLGDDDLRSRCNVTDRSSIMKGRRAMAKRQRANASSHGHGRYGYRYIHNLSHPSCDNYGYVAEHRTKIEQQIKRFLGPSEEVHHINLVRDDNRLINLMLFTDNSDHLSFHKWCERCGLYVMGIIKDIQEVFTPKSAIFWDGRWLNEIHINQLISGYSSD